MDKEARDIFISYTHEDVETAAWMARTLETAGFKVYYQDRDFLPGESFPRNMSEAQRLTRHTLAVVSRQYLKSHHATEEFFDAVARSKEHARSLIPVRIDDCDLAAEKPGLIYIDLGPGRSQDDAKRLVQAVKGSSTAHVPPENYSQLVFERQLDGGDDEVFSVAVSYGHRWIAAGSYRKVLLWDRSDLQQPIKLKGPGSYVYSVAFSRDGAYLACGGEDRHVRVWNLASRELLWKSAMGQHTDAVYSVAFSPDGRHVVSGGYDRHVNLWHAASGKLLREGDRGLDAMGRVTSVAFAPDGDHIAIASLDNKVRLWNIRSGQVTELGQHQSSVESVAFSPDGRRLASCGLDKAVRLWDVAERRELWSRVEHEYLVRSVAFSPGGSTVASAGWDKTLRLWSADNGDFLHSIPVGRTEERPWHTDWVWSVAFDPEGTMLATGGSDGKVLLWQVS
jgi:WD40 repeat protein